MSTELLLVLLAVTHVLYDYAPNRWAAFASGLGALTAILLWHVRGPRFKARWWLCLWGSFQGWQVFVCQGFVNWGVGAPPFDGMCSATGFKTYWLELGALAVIAGLVASEGTWKLTRKR